MSATHTCSLTVLKKPGHMERSGNHRSRPTETADTTMQFGILDLVTMLLVTVGPLKALIIDATLTAKADADIRRQVAIKTVTTATIVSLVFVVAGEILLRIFHVSPRKPGRSSTRVGVQEALFTEITPGRCRHRVPGDDQSGFRRIAALVHHVGTTVVAGPAGAGTLMTLWPDARENREAAAVVARFHAVHFEPLGGTLNGYATMQVWAQAVEQAGTFELKPSRRRCQQ